MDLVFMQRGVISPSSLPVSLLLAEQTADSEDKNKKAPAAGRQQEPRRMPF